MNYLEAYRSGIRKVASLPLSYSEIYKIAFVPPPMNNLHGESANNSLAQRVQLKPTPMLPGGRNAQGVSNASPAQIADSAQQSYMPLAQQRQNLPKPNLGSVAQTGKTMQTPYGTVSSLPAKTPAQQVQPAINALSTASNAIGNTMMPMVPMGPTTRAAGPAPVAAAPLPSVPKIPPIPPIPGAPGTQLADSAGPTSGAMPAPAPAPAPAPTPAPALASKAPITPANNAAFRKAHGTAFDPNSVMDQRKMQAMTTKPLGAGLASAPANTPKFETQSPESVGANPVQPGTPVQPDQFQQNHINDARIANQKLMGGDGTLPESGYESLVQSNALSSHAPTPLQTQQQQDRQFLVSQNASTDIPGAIRQ